MGTGERRVMRHSSEINRFYLEGECVCEGKNLEQSKSRLAADRSKLALGDECMSG